MKEKTGKIRTNKRTFTITIYYPFQEVLGKSNTRKYIILKNYSNDYFT